MGRKQKENAGTYDRIGEPVDYARCPNCMEHPDCFACMYGKCTALKESGGDGCVFYKPAADAYLENKQVYTELRKKGRGDLIREHADVYAALGVFDDEIREADMTADGLKSFQTADYEKALVEAEKKLSEEEEKNAVKAVKKAVEHTEEGKHGDGDADDICQPSLG